jgi:cation transport ATPase
MSKHLLITRALVLAALTGLLLGLGASAASKPELAFALWAGGTLPAIATLLISIARELWAGRLGVDAVALVSMSAALVLGEGLAAAEVAIMYAGGNMLEGCAVVRAERDLTSLIDRAPRIEHRRIGDSIEPVSLDRLAIGNTILVRAGEIVPVDAVIHGSKAILDESALTGEPIPVERLLLPFRLAH